MKWGFLGEGEVESKLKGLRLDPREGDLDPTILIGLPHRETEFEFSVAIDAKLSKPSFP